MGNLKFGTYSPTALYMGASGSTKAYLGTTEVFSGGSIDYSKEYLTFEILTGGTIVWKNEGNSTNRVISYRSNNGVWSDIDSADSGATINVNVGDVLEFKGSNTEYAGSSSVYNHFIGTASFNAYGNITSLLYGNNFTGQTETTKKNYIFLGLFSSSSIVDASNLVMPTKMNGDSVLYKLFSNCTSLTTAPALPATTLANGCYTNMFEGCTSLTTAPVLPATALTSVCYYGMFRSCRSLKYIKCLATNIGASNCLDNWVKSVAATGTFVKDPNMSSWPTGTSGIPSGWTVLDAS